MTLKRKYKIFSIIVIMFSKNPEKIILQKPYINYIFKAHNYFFDKLKNMIMHNQNI